MALYAKKDLELGVKKLAFSASGPDFPEIVRLGENLAFAEDMFSDRLKALYRECFELVCDNPLLRDYPDAYHAFLTLPSKQREALRSMTFSTKDDADVKRDRDLSIIEWVTLMVCEHDNEEAIDGKMSAEPRNLSRAVGNFAEKLIFGRRLYQEYPLLKDHPEFYHVLLGMSGKIQSQLLHADGTVDLGVAGRSCQPFLKGLKTPRISQIYSDRPESNSANLDFTTEFGLVLTLVGKFGEYIHENNPGCFEEFSGHGLTVRPKNGPVYFRPLSDEALNFVKRVFIFD